MSTKKTEQDLIDEISKCRILCAFHHRIHSQNQRTEKKKNKSDHSDTYIAVQNRKRTRENCDKVTELKLDPERFGKCEMCKLNVLEGETSGFDFDHKNPTEKYRGISRMAYTCCSWEKTILPEIDKCRLLCTNCHRIHTQVQRRQSKNDNVCRKRKRYRLPENKEELKIRDKGERPTTEHPTITNWCKKAGIPHTRRKLMEILNEISMELE